jgi:hypothetical protein
MALGHARSVRPAMRAGDGIIRRHGEWSVTAALVTRPKRPTAIAYSLL